MAKAKTIKIPLHATLEIDPKEFEGMPIEDPDKINRLVFELLEGTARVKLPSPANQRGVKGVIKFIAPNPAEINNARIKHRDCL
jgi:hypothetical protein